MLMKAAERELLEIDKKKQISNGSGSGSGASGATTFIPSSLAILNKDK